MPPPPRGQIPKSTWDQAQMYVLSEFEDIREWLREVDCRLRSIEQETAALKIKAGIFGVIGGLIPVAITIIVNLLLK